MKHLLSVLGFLLIAISLYLTVASHNLLFALTLAVSGVLLFCFGYFERRKMQLEKIVLVALLSAISAVGRVLFSAIPSVQPSSFIIIVTGMAFGPEIGLLTGIMTAISSNLLLGQGPWTIWQMFLWGGMGFFAGILRAPLSQNKLLRLIYGFLWGFLFGWGMNLWFVSGYASETSLKAFVVAGTASFIMDFAHAIANAALLWLVGDGLLVRLRRIGAKYRLG